jgi:hypothetical protein
MKYLERLVQLEAIALAGLGLTLFLEAAASARAILPFMDGTLASAPRLRLYAWTVVAFAVLLLVRAAAVLYSGNAEPRWFGFVEGPFTLAVGTLVTIVVGGWRIRSDVAPLDPHAAFDSLPWIMRFLVSTWPFYTALTILTAVFLAAFARKVFGKNRT